MNKTNLIVEPGKQEITVTRVFDATPDLVYRAFVEPDLLSKWLGPRRLTMTRCEMDVRPGGSWHFVHRDGEGHDYGFHGVFHAVSRNACIVRTFEFEGEPGHISLETATFEPQGGKTKLTTHAVYQSVADRDGMVSAGMEEGMNDGMERLDEVLKELQRAKAPVR